MHQFLSGISTVIMIITVGYYIYKIVDGTTTPNPVAWLIAFVMLFMNSISFYFVTKSFWSAAPSAVATLGVGIIIIYSSLRGKFAKIGWIDGSIFVGTVVIGFLWKTTGSHALANFLMQFILISSYTPTINGLIKGTGRESWIAWVMGASSYFFLAASIPFKPEWEWVELAYPIMTGLCGNLAVAFFAYKRQKILLAEYRQGVMICNTHN